MNTTGSHDATLDELHHQRLRALTRARAFLEAVELRDVLVVQRGEDLCLTLKPRHAFGIVSEVVGEIATSRPSFVSRAR